GTSRNLSAASGTCPIGNEQGIQVTVKCSSPLTPPPQNVPTINGCDVTRGETGRFILTVTGTNLQVGGKLKVGGQEPKKVKPGAVSGGVTTSLTAIGRFCGNLPGPITFTNLDGTTSQPFNCTKTCATQ